MVRRQGRTALPRYYRVPDGTHVDGRYAEYGDRVRPILPCARNAFLRLVDWVEDGQRPPANATISRPCEGADTLNRCRLR